MWALFYYYILSCSGMIFEQFFFFLFSFNVDFYGGHTLNRAALKFVRYGETAEAFNSFKSYNACLHFFPLFAKITNCHLTIPFHDQLTMLYHLCMCVCVVV